MASHPLVEQAQAQHKANDFDGMCTTMKQLAQADPKLGPQERHMLYIAYKCAAGKRRQALSQNPQDAGSAKELQDICGELINILSQSLIPGAVDSEAKVFYYKVMGDFYRYYDEVQPSQQNKDASLQCYQTASDWAASGLQPTNPLRLNVALNFGVCYHENLGNVQKGWEVTCAAVEAARPHVAGLQDQQKMEASMVLTMLMDNARLWSEKVGQPAPAEIAGIMKPPQGQGPPGQ